MTPPRVIILGAGPAGVGAARQLRAQGRADVTVLEQQMVPGGNAGSFEFGGLRVDFGSHRLHPATSPAIMADIRALLGEDLLDRPRHGRIGLRGRWIHFPLKPADLMLRLDPGFALGSLRDMLAKPFRSRGSDASFADVLMASLGPTICESFYFPYAIKMWGYPANQLSAIQAKRRVSASSFTKLLRKVLNSVPGFKPPGAGRYFYPRQGFGQITEAYADDATRLGATIRYGTRVTQLTTPSRPGATWTVDLETPDGAEQLHADHVWSTIPVAVLARLVTGAVPPSVIDAAKSLQSRAMILVYLELPVSQFTEFDAHYLPSADVRITRLSEPKNYSARSHPAQRTVLCAELPCSVSDDVWSMDDRALGDLVARDLQTSGIPLPASPVSVHTKRLRQAYPIYTIGYERAFNALDQWVDTLPQLLSFGRQGLFAHDNTHHALAMAYAASECLGPSGFDRERWHRHRGDFERHVVED